MLHEMEYLVLDDDDDDDADDHDDDDRISINMNNAQLSPGLRS